MPSTTAGESGCRHGSKSSCDGEAVGKVETPARAGECDSQEGNVMSGLREGIQINFPHENLRRWGCYFFALLRWAEEIRGRGFNERDIVPLFDQARATGAITETCFVQNPVALLNFLAGKRVVSGIRKTNEAGAPVPSERIHVVREKHPRFGAHFRLSIDGRSWDSHPLEGRVPAGFRVLA